MLAVLAMALPAQAKKSVKVKTKRVTLTADNMLLMDTYFDFTSVAIVAQQAKILDAKLPSKEPLFLVIDSGGGGIDAGLEMISNLNALNRPIHTITLFSASMGFQTVQGLRGKRLILPDGTLMSHKARGRFGGEFPGQLDSRYSYYLKRVDRMNKLASKRTGGVHTLKSYNNLIENEYWCDGVDCLRQGFADYLAKVSCGESLSGTKLVLWRKLFRAGHKIEIFDVKSQCPTITGFIDYVIHIDGKPLNKFKQEDASYYGASPETKAITLAIKEQLVQRTESKATRRKIIKGY